MKKMRVMTVVGTRPEIIRLSCVLKAFDRHFDHILVHTGQNYDYELNEIFFNELSIRKPDYFLGAAVGSASQTIGNIIIEVDKVLEKESPEAVLVLGDTNSCLSVIPAKRRKIPIFHMEAGNRCFDMRVPEEINRRIVDHTADINLTYSDIAREYLLAEGLNADQVIKTGSPMFEVLNSMKKEFESSNVLEKFKLDRSAYYVVSVHREENVQTDLMISNVKAVLDDLALDGLPIIVSTHPRTRKRFESMGYEFPSNVVLMKPLGFIDYVGLQCNAKAVLSDSGTINEESSILGFPALNLREAHERPEGMEEAAVMMVGLDKERVRQGLDILNVQTNSADVKFRAVADYSMPNVSEKVVRIVLSYTDYVNRVVWKKY